MGPDNSGELLRRFTEERSEEAFRRLVRRHAPLVHGTALRRLNGDRAAAEDVMQEVFTLLAQQATRLQGVVLAGWLYRQTCRRAANHVRTELRRREREKTAMEIFSTSEGAVPPGVWRELDEAMLVLPRGDREALLLRFHEVKDYQTLGQALGISEEAARKRVNRALEKLARLFRRKGVSTTASLLGSTLSGFGSVSASEAVLARLSAEALRSRSAAGAVAALSLLKPIAAGIVATALVTGVTRMMQDRRAGERGFAVSATRGEAVAGRERTRQLDLLPAGASLDAIIEEIKRIQAGPSNAWTALRLSAALERIGTGRTAEFIGRANARLNPAERGATYDPVLRRWLESDPEPAMTFVLLENVGSRVDAWTSTKLLHNLFQAWREKDPGAARDWLLRHWEDPVMREDDYGGSTRNVLSMGVFEDLLDHGEEAALRGFLQAIPAEADRRKAFEQVTGASHRGNLGRFHDVGRGLYGYRLVAALAEPAWRREVMQEYLKSWVETAPEELAGATAAMSPADRFEAALGRLAAHNVPGEITPSVSGGYIVSAKPNDPALREREARRAGEAAGLPRAEVLEAIGAVLLERLPPDQAQAWLDEHRDEVHLDDRLAAKARKECASRVRVAGVPPEMAAIQWAARIADADRRARLCRGAFRSLCANDHAAAAARLEQPDLPQDLRATFHAILEELK